MSIHLRCYSEATEARFASRTDGDQRELRNAGNGVVIARTPLPARGRYGIVEFLERSEGGRIYCDINELPKFVKP